MKGKPHTAAITLDHHTERRVLHGYRAGLRTFREAGTAFACARDQLAALRPDLGAGTLSALVRDVIDRHAPKAAAIPPPEA